MKPYYEHAGITIYHADCREVLPSLAPGGADMVLTDPPYGINAETCHAIRGNRRRVYPRDYPPVTGDDSPFDPAPLLHFPKLIIFGANAFANLLPPSYSWIVWDKRRGCEAGNNPDAELAWTNLGGTVRVFSHRWIGLLQDSEIGEQRQHPTQKPIALMKWCLNLAQPFTTVLDPFMGSGPVLIAAKHANRRAIGIEIEERYCEIAAKRLSQEVLEFTA